MSIFGNQNRGASAGGQAVNFGRTSSAAETTYTTTTVSLPKSGKPTYVKLTAQGSAVLVQVQGLGQQFMSIPVNAQQTETLDISYLPESTEVEIQTEILASGGSIVGSVGYQ